MRELTQSMSRFSWVMSLFGFEQLARMMGSGGSNADQNQDPAAAFDTVSQAAHKCLSNPLSQAFETGDRMLRAVCDSMLGGGRMGAWGAHGHDHGEPPFPVGDPSPFGGSGSQSSWPTDRSWPTDTSWPDDASRPGADWGSTWHNPSETGHPASPTPGWGTADTTHRSWPHQERSASTDPSDNLDWVGSWGPMPATNGTASGTDPAPPGFGTSHAMHAGYASPGLQHDSGSHHPGSYHPQPHDPRSQDAEPQTPGHVGHHRPTMDSAEALHWTAQQRAQVGVWGPMPPIPTTASAMSSTARGQG